MYQLLLLLFSYEFVEHVWRTILFVFYTWQLFFDLPNKVMNVNNLLAFKIRVWKYLPTNLPKRLPTDIFYN